MTNDSICVCSFNQQGRGLTHKTMLGRRHKEHKSTSLKREKGATQKTEEGLRTEMRAIDDGVLISFCSEFNLMLRILQGR